MKRLGDWLMGSLRPKSTPPVASTEPILELTSPDHERSLKRADAVLRVIEDFRAMDGRIARRYRT